MTDPFADSWGDLAAEFGIEPPPKPIRLDPEPEPEPVQAAAPFPTHVHEPAPLDLADSIFGEGVPLPDAQDDSNDTEVIPATEDMSAEEADRKRRRRRRRKKGEIGAGPEGEDAPPVERPAEPANDNLTQPSDSLRELIAKWDVPSWDEIVAGLYRPNR